VQASPHAEPELLETLIGLLVTQDAQHYLMVVVKKKKVAEAKGSDDGTKSQTPDVADVSLAA
jgi:hypothetical protein